jgi:hypothetical protein
MGLRHRLDLVTPTFRLAVWGLSSTYDATPIQRKTMTDETKQKFLVLYLIPSSVMADWAKTEPAKRQAEEQKMRAAWGKWMGEHAKMIISTEAGGKTKRITASGISDTKNDIILCSFVEAESHEAAAKAFENHPHLQIPQSSIEVMAVRPMGGM